MEVLIIEYYQTSFFRSFKSQNSPLTLKVTHEKLSQEIFNHVFFSSNMKFNALEKPSLIVDYSGSWAGEDAVRLSSQHPIADTSVRVGPTMAD